MSKRNAFAEFSADDIRALGSDAMPELLSIMEERADALDTSFGKVARRLPEAWRQIVLAARAIEGIEECDALAGAFVDLRRTKDVLALEALFKDIGAHELAKQFEYAREHTAVLVDEDMDPLEIEELRDIGPEGLELSMVRAALGKRAAAMTKPFPAAS